MKDKKIIFMGTPSFCLPILEALIKETNVVGVVTQPDKETGRKKVLTPSPVKTLALKNHIPVYQPAKIRNDFSFINELKPDIIITCAYGQFLPEELIYIPEYNTINVHASLLPKLRGGAPIQRAIIDGYQKTGITIMETDKGMDSGKIISKEEISISKEETYDTLKEKLSAIAPNLLIKTLPLIFAKVITYKCQNEKEVTTGYIIKKEDEHIDFNDDALNIIRKIRGLSSEPGSFANLNGERIKIYNAKETNNKSTSIGKIIAISKEGIEVSTKNNNILITDLSMPGKRRTSFPEIYNGLNKEKLINQIFD